MTKKMIYAPVGATPTVKKMTSGVEYIDYGYSYHSSVSFDSQSLDSVIDDLRKIRYKYGSEYSDMTIESKRDCGCWGDCSCSPSYYVQGKRLETDLEYDIRMKDEARRKAEQDERDRRAYEALKAKFES